MEKYKLLGVKKRTSKQGKEYFICAVCLETDYDFTVINIMVKPEQVDYINMALEDKDFNVAEYLSLKYNTFTKQYNLQLTLGLSDK